MRILRYILIMATLTSPLASTTVIENKATLPILTPSLSEMKQEKIRLDNGLEAILISDPNTDKSGAMLSVQVGSWEDPIEHPGIAHFLEHMLFLGTKKYPNEGDYHQYIRDNGGQANAFTANHITSYMFAIDNNAFDGALDRFSQFFKEPLFNPSGVSRELNAIDQEYEKNVENDDIREHYVYKALLKKDHPYYRFNMGNSDTLKNVTREELQQWYTEHYSANLMRLMVISTDPIDKLKEQVVDNFSGIKNYNRNRFTTTERYTPKEALGKLTVVEPIKDSRTLSIVWELPENFVTMKEVKPDSIICHVIGHEGEESLLAQLKRENLAHSLSCGASNSGAINSDMYIEIGLTDKGFHEYLTVAERVFQALNNFKAKGLPKYLFNEVQASQKLKYQYRAREDVFTSLMKHGMTINDESIETYPEQTKIVQEYAPEKVQDLLAYLTPQNAIFLLKAPSGTSNFTPDTMEKWLEVPYSTHSFSDGTLERWELITPHKNINLPSPNPFLPESLKIVASESTSLAHDTLLPQPTLLEDSNEGMFYYCLDSKFHEPKVSWFVEIKTPTITIEDPSSLVMGDLYVKLLKDNLKKYSYPAEMAGLSYQISREDNGIGIAIIGFSDKAEKLLSIILETIGNGTLNFNDFKTYKETLLKKYQNFTKESPLQQTSENLKKVIYKNYVSEKEKAAAIRKMSLKKFQSFVESLYNKTYIEAMFYGNTSKKDASNLISELKTTFNKESYPTVEQYTKEIISLPADKGPFYVESKIKMQGNAAILALEFEPFDFKARAAQSILMQGISGPFFSELRTKQQTGYIVFSTDQDIDRHLFNLFAVQSVTHDPRDLLSRFELFIENFLQEMQREEFTEERFNKIKEATVKELEAPAKSVEVMGSLLEMLAFEFHGDFMWMDKRLSTTKALTYEEFIDYAKKMLGKKNKRRLAILVRGALEDKSLNYTRATSASEVRNFSTYSASDTEVKTSISQAE